MRDGFVRLDVWLAPQSVTSDADSARAPQPEMQPEPQLDDSVAAAAQARRFAAALCDAVDAALDGLLRAIACDVLARELQVAPADIAAIAKRALEQYAGEEPLQVRAHPDELSAVATLGVPAVADARLRRGDVVFDVHSGTIDASLQARLETVLALR